MPAPNESTAPVPPWQQTLNHLLWKAAQAMHRTLNDELGELGLTVSQFALAVALDEYAPLSAADLARSQGLTPQTVNTALAQVDRLGWLRRRPHPVHKRVVLLELTEPGHEGVARGRTITDHVVSRITASLGGAEEARSFRDALRRVAEELDGPDTPAVSLWPERTRS
ncbi:MarR family winged helix-turn-helix transcriptional regulator [Streptomyces sp. LP11]|uniref:MarR family winged helix-turn-helix transcriptional regulator n=1 Tax=Streptomyces pyxinicus TaxID=2970331 RepID=A0ABT2ATZ0_9ACTN|nr:MarR family winged helix-turn-helix transcriptional regulator [Streptomyces sp. LP11]MCS0599706.1 MarR family winged helix-turn-helix transcriptional regulator [Streptomyces sp. LP11]